MRKNKFALILSLISTFNVSQGENKMDSLTRLDNIKLEIIQAGNPVLRNIAKPLSKEEILSPSIQQLILLMKNTVENVGVGLAAPQVGIPLQIAVIEDRKEYYINNLTTEEIQQRDRHPVPFHVIINPKLTLIDSEKKATFYEGCLSVAGFSGKVSRALKVEVEALNEKGEPIRIIAKGWYARILQHEIDHLNGILYIDRMQTQTFTTFENYKKYVTAHR